MSLIDYDNNNYIDVHGLDYGYTVWHNNNGGCFLPKIINGLDILDSYIFNKNNTKIKDTSLNLFSMRDLCNKDNIEIIDEDNRKRRICSFHKQNNFCKSLKNTYIKRIKNMIKKNKNNEEILSKINKYINKIKKLEVSIIGYVMKLFVRKLMNIVPINLGEVISLRQKLFHKYLKMENFNLNNFVVKDICLNNTKNKNVKLFFESDPKINIKENERRKNKNRKQKIKNKKTKILQKEILIN